MSSFILGVDCWKRGVAKGKEEEGSCADREPENGFLLAEGPSTDFVVEEEDAGRKRLPGAGVYDLLTHLCSTYRPGRNTCSGPAILY
jgi:hypothetical protein